MLYHRPKKRRTVSSIHQKNKIDLYGNVIFEVNKGITVKVDLLIDPIASVVEQRIEPNLIKAS